MGVFVFTPHIHSERTEKVPFITIVQDILDNNPWDGTAYESRGISHPAVETSKETYAASINYEKAETKMVGQIPVKGQPWQQSIPQSLENHQQCHDHRSHGGRGLVIGSPNRIF